MQSENKKEMARKQLAVGKVVFSLSAVAAFTKIFGFAEKLIVAHFFGTEMSADIYFASMGIVLSIVFLVKELTYPSLLPVFSETLSMSANASAILFKKMLFYSAAVLIVPTACMVMFPDTFTFILVPGFSEDKKQLTSIMLKFLAPGCLFLGLSTITYAVLNCRRNFLKAALPEAGFKFFVAGGLIALAPIMGIYALAVVVAVGATVAFFTQLYFIPESRNLFKHNSYKANDDFRNVLKLMGPLVIGVAFSHISGLVDTMLASTLPTGHLSYLVYSKKIIDAVLLIGPVALVTVVYSQLAHLSSQQSLDEFRVLFTKALRLILYVSLPVTLLLVSLREPFIQTLFERGKFTYQSTFGTSQGLFVYGVGLVTFSLEVLIVYSFYALSNTKTPVKAGIFGVCLDIILAVAFVRPFGFTGIAWAFVISKTIKVVILFAFMERKLNFLVKGVLAIFLIKLVVATLLSAFILQLLTGIKGGVSFVHTVIFDLAIPAAGFLSIFVFCSYLLRIDELRQLLTILLRKKTSNISLSGKGYE